MTRRSILWVTAEPPNGRLGGGSIRQAQLLRRLARLVDVDLLVVGDGTDEGVRSAVRSVVEIPEPPGRPARPAPARLLHTVRTLAVDRSTTGISAERARAGALIERARTLAPGHDAVVAVHESLADAVPADRDQQWHLHLHHVVATRSAQRAALERSARRRVLHRVEAANAARWMKRTIPRWDGLITVSADDAIELGVDAVRTTVAPNGVDLDAFRPTPRPADGPLVLTASLDYPPNIDGARWFVDEVWPRIRQRHPERRLQLVGRSPVPAVAELASRPGVSVHGDVPDIPPWLGGAAVVVVPLRVGTGTRLKALEAMAAGRPVVGTTIGLEGLGIRPGTHALVADDPEAFAVAVDDVLRAPALAERLSISARALVEASGGWDAVAARLVADLWPADRR